MLSLILYVCVFISAFNFGEILTNPLYNKKHTCGYCPKPKDGYLNVHMVSHTHNDAGWLKTVDQYFYGSKKKIQWAGVQYIIDSIVEGLVKNPNRRFMYVESAFFWKWWQLQNENIRNKVKNLVNEGRLEFIGGGWTMHDEATTHYQSIIDQMSWGFRRLDDSFGDCARPRVGWQIDPFGHSRESASIMARFGFDGLLFGRLDYQDQGLRKYERRLEMIWESSANLGTKSDLFTSILYNLYSAPDWFCFDVVCGDPPIIDDKESPDYNADKRAADFVKYVNEVAKVYTTNNVLITMGGDFTYQAGSYYFLNLDRLMKAVNEIQPNGSKMNLFYSTPSCYLKAVNDEQMTYTTKNDDFFPYASQAHAYWTGFFTSRPTLKYFERIGNNFLQVCKQLFTIAGLDRNNQKQLNTMREAMGILQHHDAITGTEKQHVAFDYARQLNKGFTDCGNVANLAFRKLMEKETIGVTNEDILLQSCMLLNISSCEITENNNTFVVTLYNPLSRKVSRYVRLPVKGNGDTYTIYDPSGNLIKTQTVPIPHSVLKIPGRTSLAKEEVVFLAKDLPMMGYRSYYVSEKNTNEISGMKMKKFRNNYIHDKERTKIRIGDVTVDQSFWWYKSYAGNNIEEQSSGAYIFRPNGQPHQINDKPKYKQFTGPIVDEIHQVFNDWVSQVIRTYHGTNYVEYDWLIGPIPIRDNKGKEIISTYTVDSIASDVKFYTDSNGRETLVRVRDQRPTFNISLKEPVAGNYYPITTRIMIKDDVKQFSVITDRAQGGSSIQNGQIELMLHRRILHDDGFGVSEPLNEIAFGEGLVVRGSHYITSGDPLNQTALDRLLIQEKVLAAWTFFTPTTKTIEEWKNEYNMEFSALKKELPKNIQVMTLEPWSDNSYFLRVEHIMEKDDDTDMSKSVVLNLKDIFQPFKITSIEETTLGGNELLKNMKRLKWNKESNVTSDGIENDNVELPNIKLKVMEIRSFIVSIEY